MTVQVNVLVSGTNELPWKLLKSRHRDKIKISVMDKKIHIKEMAEKMINYWIFFFYNTINKRMLAWCKTAVSPLAVCLCTVSHPKNQNVLPLHFINGILSEWIDVAEPYVEFVWGWKLQVTVWYSWLISTSEMDMIQQIEQTLGQQEFNFVSTKP